MGLVCLLEQYFIMLYHLSHYSGADSTFPHSCLCTRSFLTVGSFFKPSTNFVMSFRCEHTLWARERCAYAPCSRTCQFWEHTCHPNLETYCAVADNSTFALDSSPADLLDEVIGTNAGCARRQDGQGFFKHKVSALRLDLHIVRLGLVFSTEKSSMSSMTRDIDLLPNWFLALLEHIMNVLHPGD